MIFLIEYDRQHGQIVNFTEFKDSERQQAEDTRLERELDLNRHGIKYEVVILEAVSEEALRKTHRRYFENLSELAASAATGITEAR
jgi:hypothetical protein